VVKDASDCPWGGIVTPFSYCRLHKRRHQWCLALVAYENNPTDVITTHMPISLTPHHLHGAVHAWAAIQQAHGIRSCAQTRRTVSGGITESFSKASATRNDKMESVLAASTLEQIFKGSQTTLAGDGTLMAYVRANALNGENGIRHARQRVAVRAYFWRTGRPEDE